VYIHILITRERYCSGERERERRGGTAVNAASQGNLSACNRFISPGLRGALRESRHCPLQEGRKIKEKEK
jgi:hypothetical protein